MIFHLQKECGEIRIKNDTNKLIFFLSSGRAFRPKILAKSWQHRLIRLPEPQCKPRRPLSFILLAGGYNRSKQRLFLYCTFSCCVRKFTGFAVVLFVYMGKTSFA
jgi:hypothetical protein